MNDDFILLFRNFDRLFALRAGTLFAREFVADLKAGEATRAGDIDGHGASVPEQLTSKVRNSWSGAAWLVSARAAAASRLGRGGARSQQSKRIGRLRAGDRMGY